MTRPNTAEPRERGRIAREGYPFIGAFLILALVCLVFGARWLALLPGLLVLFSLWFFRDPARFIPLEEGLIVSPADGKVLEVVRGLRGSAYPDGSYSRVAIFLSVFNVHVNRAPVSGEVEGVEYTPGRFLPANRSRASVANEQNRVDLRSSESGGRDLIPFTQIAGLVARRIACYAKPGDKLQRGERVGLIRFGSRTEILFPDRYLPEVRPGDRVRGGTSVIARLTAARDGGREGNENVR